jgi:tetratricopeptide (TPR) repeat protein
MHRNTSRIARTRAAWRVTGRNHSPSTPRPSDSIRRTRIATTRAATPTILTATTRAIDDYSKAIELNPKNALFWENRGISRRFRGQWDQAYADFQKAIELEPQVGSHYNARANAYHAQGEYELAIADYTQAIELSQPTSIYFENRANSQRLAGHWGESLADYAQAIRLEPQNAARYNARGDAFCYKADYSHAIDDYTTAIRLEPTNALYLENRGISQRLLGRYAPALQDHNAAIRIDPSNGARYNARGNVYFNNADYPRAIDDYTEAIRLAPKTAIYYENRANAYIDDAKFDEAFADYAKAIELEPENAERYNARGNARHRRGVYDEAIADYERAIKLDPKTAVYASNRQLSLRDRQWSQAQSLRGARNYGDAVQAGVAMLAIEREWLGADNVETVRSVEWIAKTYQEAALAQLPEETTGDAVTPGGPMAENLVHAEERFVEALAWREKHFGKDHWTTIDARIALADVRLLRTFTLGQLRKFLQYDAALDEAAQRYDDAEYGASLQAADKAAALCQEIFTDKHASYATCLGNVARAYAALGEPLEAKPTYERALGVRKAALGALHPQYVTSLDDLAALNSRLAGSDAKYRGLYLEAHRQYEQARDTRRTLLGEHNVEYAMSLRNLAELETTIQNYVRAEEGYRQAAEIVRSAKGENSAEYAACVHDLAALYEHMGNFDAAELNYNRAIDIRKKALGADHPLYAYSLAGLAGLNQRQGMPGVAEAATGIANCVDHVETNSYRLTEPANLFSQSLQFYRPFPAVRPCRRRRNSLPPSAGVEGLNARPPARPDGGGYPELAPLGPVSTRLCDSGRRSLAPNPRRAKSCGSNRWSSSRRPSSAEIEFMSRCKLRDSGRAAARRVTLERRRLLPADAALVEY